MEKKILIFTLIIITMISFVVNVWADTSSYIFVKKWGSLGDREEQFAGRGMFWDYYDNTTYTITDEVIEILRNKFNNEKLKILESFKNRVFDRIYDAESEGITDPYALPGIVVDNSGELENTLYDLKFTTKELELVMLASSSKRGSNKEFNGPPSIAIDKSDNVYVSDKRIGKIKKFDSEGNFILNWESGASNRAITVDWNDYVYVMDSYYHCVGKYDSEGDFILKWGEEGTDDEKVNVSESIAADHEGYVYVIDSSVDPYTSARIPSCYTSYLKKFDSTGKFILSRDLGFQCYAIAIDPKGHIFLAANDNFGGTDIIKLKSLDGELADNREWCLTSKETGLKGRINLAADMEGNLFVVSREGNCVYKFDSSGKLLTKWGSFGCDNGEFNRPEAIAVDSKGNVYVMDTGNYRIQKFAPNPDFNPDN